MILFTAILYRKRPALFKRIRPHFVLDTNGDVRNSMNIEFSKLFFRFFLLNIVKSLVVVFKFFFFSKTILICNIFKTIIYRTFDK